MIPSPTLAGAIHAALALLWIAVGLLQLLCPKRGAGHRARGYLFVYAMIAVDALALLVYRATGTFNVLHAGAIANFACIVIGIVPLLCSPRPRIQKYLHYFWIAWSYVGLLSAGATQLVIGLSPPQSPGQAWAMTLAVTVTVGLIGYMVIERNRPIPDSGPAAGTMQRDGVPS
jgi:uncharacterized membrane protein